MLDEVQRALSVQLGRAEVRAAPGRIGAVQRRGIGDQGPPRLVRDGPVLRAAQHRDSTEPLQEPVGPVAPRGLDTPCQRDQGAKAMLTACGPPRAARGRPVRRSPSCMPGLGSCRRGSARSASRVGGERFFRPAWRSRKTVLRTGRGVDQGRTAEVHGQQHEKQHPGRTPGASPRDALPHPPRHVGPTRRNASADTVKQIGHHRASTLHEREEPVHRTARCRPGVAGFRPLPLAADTRGRATRSVRRAPSTLPMIQPSPGGKVSVEQVTEAALPIHYGVTASTFRAPRSDRKRRGYEVDVEEHHASSPRARKPFSRCLSDA